MKPAKIQVGDIFPTNQGGSVTVLEYQGCYRVLVKHNDDQGHRAVVQTSNLRAGVIKNPYQPLVLGVGYLGVGVHKSWESGKPTVAYVAWHSMLGRCYDPVYQAKNPTYKGCSVVVDWHNLQTFSHWFYDQPNSGKPGFELDKDMIVTGNRIYSPDACSYVPAAVNNLLNHHASERGSLPQGVTTSRNRFKAAVRVNGKRINVGVYDTPAQAGTAYTAAKKRAIRAAAEKWKEYLHPTVYKNLCTWGMAL